MAHLRLPAASGRRREVRRTHLVAGTTGAQSRVRFGGGCQGLRIRGPRACHAEQYLLDKLKAMDATYEELQEKLGRPEVASNPDEYREISKSIAQMKEPAEGYRKFLETEASLKEAR